MPAIDFEARRVWFVDHLSRLRGAGADVVCAFDTTGEMAGFVTIDPVSGHLDQLAVAPERWGGPAGSLLIDAAKRRSPGTVTLEVNQDHPRAIAFYEKHGFVRVGAGVNTNSGLRTWRYAWRKH
jgi:putative acetyltransferase